MQDIRDDPNVQANLAQISKTLKIMNYSELNQAVKPFELDGATVIVDFSIFRATISSSATFKISKDDTAQLAKLFKYEPKGLKKKSDKAFVNLTAMQAAIEDIEDREAPAAESTKDKRQKNQQGLRVLDKVAKVIEEYIAENGGSVFECFNQIDVGDDNYIQTEEFLSGMKAMGCDVTNAEIRMLYQVIDENQDGMVSYGEFAKYIASIHSTKKIDNADHPLFTPMDQVRRSLRVKGNTVKKLFGVTGNSVQWDQFITGLEKANVWLNEQQIDILGDLMDCKDNKDMVDLVLFQQLAGVHIDDVQANKNTLKARKEMVKSAQMHSELRALKRKIYMPLIEENMTSDSLQQDLEITAVKVDKKNPLIELKKFVLVIVGSIPDGKMLEGDITKFAGYFKDDKKPTDVSIKKFIEDFKSYNNLFKIEAYMFGQLDGIKHKKKLQIVDSLILRDSNDVSQTAQEFGQTLLKNQIKLDEMEVQIIASEFDPTGENMNINLKLFIEEYIDWHSSNCAQSKLKQNRNRDLQIMSQPPVKNTRGATATPSLAKPKGAPEADMGNNSKIIQDIITRITQDYAVSGFNLSALFGGFKSSTVSKNEFIDEVNKSLKGFRLTRGEEDALADHYKPRKHSDQHEYQKFKQDIRKESSKSNNVQDRILDENERKLIDKIKAHIETKDLTAKFVIEFKQRDPHDRKMLQLTEIQAAVKSTGLALAAKEFDDLFRILRPNNEGRYAYMDLLTLLFGQFAAQQLGRQSILELQNSTKQSSATFKCPTTIQQPKTGRLGVIGEALIKTQQNYEEGFLKTSGDVNRVKPVINEDLIKKALGQLGVKDLSQEIWMELTQYCVDLGRGEQKQVQLVQFLIDIGLPPQTLGAEAVRSGEPQRILSEEEKAKCQHIFIQLGKSLPKGKGKGGIDWFTKDKNGQVKADDFFNTIKRMSDKNVQEVIKKNKIESMLPTIVLYLYQDNQITIQHSKLAQALAATEKDLPLVQQGTKDIIDYKSSLKKEALQDGKKKNALGEFLGWMIKNDYSIKTLLPGIDPKLDTLPQAEFKTQLKYKKFVSSDDTELMVALDKPKTGKTVNLKLLADELRKAQLKSKPSTSSQLANFPKKVQTILDDIQASLKKDNWTPEKLHAYLDENGDGNVDKKEFVERLAGAINKKSMIAADIGLVFDTLDRNNDGKLSVNEFKTYIKGVERSREKRVAEMDPTVTKQIRDEVTDLFEHFDQNGDGEITPDEIKKTLEAFGMKRTVADCKEMIQSVNGGSSDKLNRQQFGDLMIPIMMDQLLTQEDNVEDLRKVFLEADVDYSGYLSVGELWAALKKKGADISLDDVCQIMAEIDIDRDGQLDIDEFISLMSLGDQLPLVGQQAKSTYQKIQKSRKMNPVDFVRAFKNMPTNFVPSFVDELWSCGRLNLPSSVFKAQIDPKTMLWKDVRQVNTEDLRIVEKNFKPKLRPMEVSIGGLISIDKAEGVPLPKVGTGQAFKDEDIVKRAVRIAVDIKSAETRHLVHNAIQVPAEWSKETNEDIWTFDKSDSSLRHVLFRTATFDELEVKDARILFELVVYVKNEDGNINEMSCGWCNLPLEDLKTKQSGKSLNITGGSPFAEVEIKEDDVRAKRTGFAAVQKAFTGVQQRIIVDILPHTGIRPQEQRQHLNLLPSTCFVHQSLIYFVSGFMNYKAEKLLKEMTAGAFRKPGGDVVISSFPKIYDNPDIVEELSKIWVEYALPEIKKSGELNCDFIMEKTVSYCQKLYPILFSEEFMGIEHTGTTKSGAGYKNSNQDPLDEIRRTLVSSALLQGEKKKGNNKENKAPNELTTYKPFSIRELEFDVWDCTRSKRDKFINSINKGEHAEHVPPPKSVTFQDS